MNWTLALTMTRFQRNLFFSSLWMVAVVGASFASKPPEYGVYGVQRIANKTAEVGDPISAASGAFSWSKVLIPLGGPMGLDFSIHYRTDPNAAFARDPGDFPPGYPDFNTYLNAWSWQPAPLLLGNGFFDMTVLLEDGGQVCFQTNTLGDFVFANLPEISAGVDQNYQLTRVESWFYFCDPERGRVTSFQPISFDANQLRPVTVEDRNGNRLTYTYEFPHYDSNPSSIADDEGRRLDFSYESYTTPSWGVRKRLATVSDHAGRVWTFLYETNAPDNNGRLTFRAVVGPDGKTNRFVYAPNDFAYEADNMASNLSLLAAVVEPLGNATFSNEYAATQLHPETPIHPRCVAQSDAYGNRLTLDMSYATGNFVGSVTNADGTSNRFVHHNHHDVPPASIQDEAGNTIGLTRNASAQIRSVTDRLGGTTAFGYDATGRRLESVTNAAGQVLRYAYQTATQLFHNATANHDVGFVFEQLTRVDYPDGTFEAFAYDGRGNATSILDRAGAAWSFAHDAHGRLLSSRTPTGGETTYVYATNGALRSVSNSDGFVQAYAYDAWFRLTAATNADGSSVRLAYDIMGRTTQTVSEVGATNRFEFDANGRLVRSVDPLGHVEVFQYDRMNRPTNEVDRAGGVSTVAYDSRGRPSVLVDAAGVATAVGYGLDGLATNVVRGGLSVSRAYNAEHLPVATKDSAGAVSAFQRDSLGRLTNAVDARGATTGFRRDAQGRVLSKTDPLGRATTYAYDAAGRLAAVTNPGGASAVYAYDAAGNLAQLRDPRSNLWTFAHTANGRLASISDPLGRATAYAYDARGRLAVVTNADLSTVTLAYDAASRLTNVTYSTHSPAASAFEYDAAGRLVAAESIRFELDAEDRITNTTQGAYFSSARRDAAGRLVSVGYANDAFRVDYSYNATNGLLTGVRDTLTGRGVAFRYDAAGRLAEVRRTNGVHDAITYDAVGEVERIQTAPHLDLRYTFDLARQVTQCVASVALAPTSFPATATFTYDAASQISTAGYGHDARGRLTNAPFGSFAWDAADRLVEASGVQYFYDGLGNLVRRVAAGQTNHFLYNHALSGAPLVSERDGGSFRRHYVWTPDGRLLYLIDAAEGNQVFYYHFDRAGNTLALTDATGGVAVAYAHDPFGRLLAQSGALDQPFTFAGAHGLRREGSNGLYHVRARWYDARIQRFLSKEPLWPTLDNPALLNPYQYALNNPALFVDADGLSALLNTLHHHGVWTQDWKKDADLVARRVSMTTALMQQAAFADLMGKFDGWAYVEPQDILELAGDAWVRHAGANPAVQKTYGKARRERGARLHRAFAALPNQDNPALALLVNALDPARSDAQRAEDRQLLFNAMGLSPGHVNWIDNDIAEKREYMDEKSIQTQYDQREGGLAFEKAFEQTFEKEIVGAGLTYIVSGEAFQTLFFGDPR